VDGTETGWGRPAEPAPRWRALLDRALLGSRTGEQQQVDDAADTGGRPEGPHPADEPRRLPTRPVNPLDRRPRNPLDPARGPQPYGTRSGGEPPTNGAADGTDVRPDGRPVSPLAPRPVSPLAPRPVSPLPQRGVDRPVNPRPVNPLDRRGRDGWGERPAEPRALEQRPQSPLDRRGSQLGDSFPRRTDPGTDAPHSFFNPSTRAVPPPIARVKEGTGYAPARAAASVGPASVLQPPAAPPVSPAAPPLQQPAPQPAPQALHQPAPQPVAQPVAQVAPQSPGRIEWRQARPDEDVERAVAVLRRALGRPRVIAFANPKGGVHKTTATVLAAATIGSVRGRGVLAWDDNELRGTLGLRAGSARHARTIRHLVAELLEIENLHGDALTDRLDDYLRHASDGSYDVLAGEENPRFAQRLDQSTVRRVMDLLRRTHDVICVDTGNNVESVNWQTVMRAADQLVITTVPREDAAFTADWMLDLLDDIGMEELAANAVTLLSCPTPGPLPLLDDLKKHFATRTRAVAVVPYDPALEVGSSIEYSVLQPGTRAAWLHAASVMIEPFGQ
jgi:MinD-like ATPase involved in chromosome partitioning or flagellar assembly